MNSTILNDLDFLTNNRKDFWQEDGSEPILKKYIGCHYPARMCNLRCPYCYVSQTTGFENQPRLMHSPEFIRWCLSQKRVGGRAIVGLCGAGETLMGDQIAEVSQELLKEGHFLHIVTNGTLKSKMREIVELAGDMSERIFFKCSLHYTELKSKNLLNVYSEAINAVSNMGASYTIELTADDNYVDLIDEIKSYSLSEFGAYPHITIARDDTKPNIPILTKYPLDEFYDIWSSFDSELFQVKWDYYSKPIKNCDAGKSSLYINLISGDVMKCLGQPVIGNLYDTNIKDLSYERVGDDCKLPYCYNNHAYLTMGTCEFIRTVSFARVRDRETIDGKHWVKEKVYRFFDQKLYEN